MKAPPPVTVSAWQSDYPLWCQGQTTVWTLLGEHWLGEQGTEFGVHIPIKQCPPPSSKCMLSIAFPWSWFFYPLKHYKQQQQILWEKKGSRFKTPFLFTSVTKNDRNDKARSKSNQEVSLPVSGIRSLRRHHYAQGLSLPCCLCHAVCSKRQLRSPLHFSETEPTWCLVMFCELSTSTVQERLISLISYDLQWSCETSFRDGVPCCYFLCSLCLLSWIRLPNVPVCLCYDWLVCCRVLYHR